jgi:hypothetical protein
MVTAIKEAFEDYNRHKADQKMNGTPVLVFDGNTWINSTWAEVPTLFDCLSEMLRPTHFLSDQARPRCQTHEQGPSSR